MQFRLFDQVADAVATTAWRPELSVEDIPAPRKMAPYALAIQADVTAAGADAGSGRLVLLHDPDGNATWDGDFRCVVYVRADIERDLAEDPLLADVGWSWLTDALDRNDACYRAASGTVTVVSNKSFGTIATDPSSCDVELRASWTPDIDEPADVAGHLAAWSDLLCEAAGLELLPAGVVRLAERRAGSWER